MILEGNVHKFGDNVSTDLIAPGRFAHLRSNLEEFAKYALVDADPDFTKKVKPGDFVVGGNNFGLGSSREQAPILLKMAGAGAVLAKSFARIFYRNCINVGLPAIICDTDCIDVGDFLRVDLENGTVENETKGIVLSTGRMPEVMVRILREGGMVPYIRKHRDIVL